MASSDGITCTCTSLFVLFLGPGRYSTVTLRRDDILSSKLHGAVFKAASHVVRGLMYLLYPKNSAMTESDLDPKDRKMSITI